MRKTWPKRGTAARAGGVAADDDIAASATASTTGKCDGHGMAANVASLM